MGRPTDSPSTEAKRDLIGQNLPPGAADRIADICLSSNALADLSSALGRSSSVLEALRCTNHGLDDASVSEFIGLVHQLENRLEGLAGEVALFSHLYEDGVVAALRAQATRPE